MKLISIIGLSVLLYSCYNKNEYNIDKEKINNITTDSTKKPGYDYYGKTIDPKTGGTILYSYCDYNFDGYLDSATHQDFAYWYYENDDKEYYLYNPKTKKFEFSSELSYMDWEIDHDNKYLIRDSIYAYGDEKDFYGRGKKIKQIRLWYTFENNKLKRIPRKQITYWDEY